MSSIQEIPSWCFGNVAFFLNIKRSCEAKRYEKKITRSLACRAAQQPGPALSYIAVDDVMQYSLSKSLL